VSPAPADGVFDVKTAELALFAAGAFVTIAVFVVAVFLYRHATAEHREQIARERRERGS